MARPTLRPPCDEAWAKPIRLARPIRTVSEPDDHWRKMEREQGRQWGGRRGVREGVKYMHAAREDLNFLNFETLKHDGDEHEI